MLRRAVRSISQEVPVRTSISADSLTITTDDTIHLREHKPSDDQPFLSRAHFGPTTVAIDTSPLGFFANPFVPEEVFSTMTSWTQDNDFGPEQARLGSFIQDLLIEGGRRNGDQPPSERYQVPLRYVDVWRCCCGPTSPGSYGGHAAIELT